MRAPCAPMTAARLAGAGCRARLDRAAEVEKSGKVAVAYNAEVRSRGEETRKTASMMTASKESLGLKRSLLEAGECERPRSPLSGEY